MSVFEQVFEIVVGHEGGYSNNAADPGGETKYGISKRSYPRVDIGALSLEGAHRIYRADYWDKIRGDDLDPGLALVCFDAAVNNGVGQAVRWLQGAVGIKADGVIGPVTLAALARADPQKVLVELHAQRIYMMAGLSTWKHFGRGWSRRLANLPYQAAKMMEGRDGTNDATA